MLMHRYSSKRAANRPVRQSTSKRRAGFVSHPNRDAQSPPSGRRPLAARAARLSDRHDDARLVPDQRSGNSEPRLAVRHIDRLLERGVEFSLLTDAVEDSGRSDVMPAPEGGDRGARILSNDRAGGGTADAAF